MAEPFPAFNPTVKAENPLTMAAGYAGLNNAVAQNKLLQQGAVNQQQEMAMRNLTAVRDNIAALSNDPDVTPEKVVQRAQMLETLGIVPKGFTGQIVQNVPNDPAALQKYLAQARTDVEFHHGRGQEFLYGRPQQFNNGEGQFTGAVNPDPGAIGYGVHGLPGSQFQNRLSPSEKAQPIPTFQNGQAGTIPLGSTVTPTGGPLPASGPIPGSGRYPAQPGAAPAAGGFNPTQPPLGQPEMVKQNQDAYNAAQADIPQAVNRIAGLTKAYGALQIINSGPGTGKVQQLRSTISALGGPDIGSADTIAAYDEARKYMQDYANRSSLGTTAQGIQASEHANASTDISNPAAQDVVRTNIGLERMAIAQAKAAQDPQAYLAHAGKFSTENDRRAFAADLYPPDKLKAMVDGMKGAERAKFMRSLATAQKMGLIGQ